MDDTDVIAALNTIFNADTGIYQQRGFQRGSATASARRSCTSISRTRGRGPGTPSRASTWT